MGLKFAFIVDKCGPRYLGGYEGKFWNLAKHLAVTNEVRVYTTLRERSCTIAGVTFCRVIGDDLCPPLRVDRSLLHSAVFSVALLQSPFKDWVPDVVVVEAIPYLQLLTGTSWLWQTNATKILFIDEVWSKYSYAPGFRGRVAGRVIRMLLFAGIRNADVIAVPSKITAAAVDALVGRPISTVVSDGVDLPADAESDKLGARYNHYDFVTVGRLVPIKRVSDYVRALAILKASAGWRGRAAIVGSGPEWMALSKLVCELGLGSQVDMVGRVEESALYSILRNSNVFVLCSEREGLSRATLEALASGLPAIVSRPAEQEVFGVSDLVVHGVNGLHFPAGSVEKLTQAMTQLILDPGLRKKMSRNASDMLSGRSWSDVADRFLAMTLYKRGLREERRG